MKGVDAYFLPDQNKRKENQRYVMVMTESPLNVPRNYSDYDSTFIFMFKILKVFMFHLADPQGVTKRGLMIFSTHIDIIRRGSQGLFRPQVPQHLLFNC